MKELKDIRNSLIFITMVTLALIVIFPKNLGARTPIWNVKKRFFGEEYGELRSKYFIDLINIKKHGMARKEFYLFIIKTAALKHQKFI